MRGAAVVEDSEATGSRRRRRRKEQRRFADVEKGKNEDVGELFNSFFSSNPNTKNKNKHLLVTLLKCVSCFVFVPPVI